MLAGILLIIVALVLGGVIANIGDHVATKIGKARLSLFNLRPKKTATLVAVFTGVMISGVSVALVLLVSERARVAVFEYDQLQANLNSAYRRKDAAEAEARAAQSQSSEARRQMQVALAERRQAEVNLQKINSQLQEARKRQQASQKQLEATEVQLRKLDRQKSVLAANAESLRGQVRKLRDEQQVLVAFLKQLENQKKQLALSLVDERKRLIATRKALVETNVRFRTEDLIFTAYEPIAKARIQGGLGSENTRAQFDQILGQIEQLAAERGARPQADCSNAVCLSGAEARQLLSQLQAPGEHALQLFSIDNAFKGEPVRVFGRVVPNQLLFHEGEVLVSVRLGREVLDDKQKLLDSLATMFSEANRRARDAGILPLGRDAKVGTFSAVDLEQLVDELVSIKSYEPVTLQAVSKQNVYTVGPLNLRLVAVQNGRVVSQAG